MRTPAKPPIDPLHWLGATVLWWIVGAALLVTTLAPAHTELLGWTPAFWLVIAPMIVLLALEPSLPRQLLARRRPRRVVQTARWHGPAPRPR